MNVCQFFVQALLKSAGKLFDSSQFDVLDGLWPPGPCDHREVLDGRFRETSPGCAHGSGRPQSGCWCGCSEAVLDQRRQEGVLTKYGGCTYSSEVVSYFLQILMNSWYNRFNLLDAVEGLMFTLFLQSVESVRTDGTARQTFTGLFRRTVFSLAVFGSSFFWVDDEGLWQLSQNHPEEKRFLSKAERPLVAVYHPLQQPQGIYSLC